MTLQGATTSAATGDMSQNITSDPVDCLAVVFGCIEATWSASGGSPTGSWVLEASGGSFDKDRPANTKWYDITARLTPALPAVSGAGSFIANLPEIGYRALRLRYVLGSGGNVANGLSVWFNGKSAG